MSPLHDVHGPSCSGSADHETRHAAVQRPSGIGAAETGESVTLGRNRKRKSWDSQRIFTPDNITLGALRRGVKRYNVGLDRHVTSYTTVGPHRITGQLNSR